MNKTAKIILSLFLLFSMIVLGRQTYMTPSYLEGEAAPNIKGKLLNGEDFQLTDLKGKYTLIHFWGSWCGPCRIENPHIRDLWLSYKDQKFKTGTGFEIVSVAIETDNKAPLRAIKQDRLSWKYHFIDIGSSLRFFDSPISNMWGVNQVPSHFLIDPNGQIVGYNLPVEQIKSFLDASAI